MPKASAKRLHPRVILMASCSNDTATIGPVAALLQERGYPVVSYFSDKVATGEIPFYFTYTGRGKLTAYYDGKPFDPTKVAAAWYRRPRTFGNIEDKAKQYWLNRERVELQNMLWGNVPEGAWLNHPTFMQYRFNKLAQLQLAYKVGFETPHTVISNKWENILQIPSKQIVLKMAYSSTFFDKGQPKNVYTHVFDNTGKPVASGCPFPAIWQAYIPKAKEWRITVVGRQTFDAAIYTAEEAKGDWRRHQDNPKKVTWSHEQFPAKEAQKCVEFMRKAGLRFGAFDFIETPDKKIVFLEVNANGQYGWLEEELDLPISRAIADELAAIADDRPN